MARARGSRILEERRLDRHRLEESREPLLTGRLSRSARDEQKADAVDVAETAIDKVEKGEGLKAGDDVQVRYYSQGWRGRGRLRLSIRAFSMTAQAGQFCAHWRRSARILDAPCITHFQTVEGLAARC